MAKVKKGTGVTGVRNVKASNAKAGSAKARNARAGSAKAGSAKAGSNRAGSTTIRSKTGGTAKAKPGNTKVGPAKAGSTARRPNSAPGARSASRPARSTKSGSGGIASPTSAKAPKHTLTAGRRTGRTTTAPAVRMAVRELDPRRKCGDGTSVQLLYRVDETVDGRATAHLVFFDRHGWYCEHGRTCPAVAHARKHSGQFTRVS